MHAFSRPAVAAVVFAMPFSISWSRADVYRCVQAGAPVSYQQIPCSSHAKPMELDDRRSGWSGLRPGERALLHSYRDRDAARGRRSGAGPKQPDADARECWKTRNQLEAVRSRLRRGYKLKQGEALHRKLENYEDYLRRFCPG